jgi:predicted transposase/invertase (TIGR01784 family)
MKFANPRNDIAFKKIFGDETQKDILISFLNAALDFKGKREIYDVTIVNPYQVPKIEDLKETILDIKAKNINGEEFIVEMQKKNLGNFAKRSQYYTAKAYIQQLDTNQNYNELKKVYFIGICDFNIFGNSNYISRHLVLNQETMKQDLNDFEFTFIELPKFKKDLSQLQTVIDKWVYFIKEAEKSEIIPKELDEIEQIHKAYEVITHYKWDKKELEVYDYIKKKEIDEESAIMTAEQKGIQKGFEQGEKNAKVAIAKSLLDVLDIKIISIKTGLSIEEIKKL